VIRRTGIAMLFLVSMNRSESRTGAKPLHAVRR
jgi:hypothetical protein